MHPTPATVAPKRRHATNYGGLLLRACSEAGATVILVTHDPAVLARFDHALDARDLVAAR